MISNLECKLNNELTLSNVMVGMLANIALKYAECIPISNNDSSTIFVIAQLTKNCTMSTS